MCITDLKEKKVSQFVYVNNHKTDDSNDHTHANILLDIRTMKQAYSRQKQQGREADPSTINQTLYLQSVFFIWIKKIK
jgi:hypothetical protein